MPLPLWNLINIGFVVGQGGIITANVYFFGKVENGFRKSGKDSGSAPDTHPRGSSASLDTTKPTTHRQGQQHKPNSSSRRATITKSPLVVLTLIEMLATAVFSLGGFLLLAEESQCIQWANFGFGSHLSMIILIVSNLLSVCVQGTLFGFLFGMGIGLKEGRKGWTSLRLARANSTMVEGDDLDSSHQMTRDASDTSRKTEDTNTEGHDYSVDIQQHEQDDDPFRSDNESGDDDEATITTYPIDDIILPDDEIFQYDEQKQLEMLHSNRNDENFREGQISAVFRRLEQNNWQPLRSRNSLRRNEASATYSGEDRL